MQKILVIDDDTVILDLITDFLESEGISVHTCQTGEDAIEIYKKDIFDAVISDLQLPGIDGIAVLKELLSYDNNAAVIIVTGHATIESAIEALRLGAIDYLRKPFNIAELSLILQRVEKQKELEIQNKTLKEELRKVSGYDNIIGQSKPMIKVFEIIDLVSETDSTVLITGESGTGKELVAKAIHYHSLRKNAPMVSINSSAIPETLLEDELFGHEKGSFTGANSSKAGRFERANGGTLFLDEIGYMSPSLQVKLLRVLQEREFERIGGTKTIKVDVRIITATSKDLQKAIEEKRFRQDLFYRLNVIQLQLPPLRERREDISILANHFINKLSQKRKILKKSISKDTLRKLFQYDWPGNVRELENCIERALIMSGKKLVIEPNDLPEAIYNSENDTSIINLPVPENGLNLKQTMEQIEAYYIKETLARCSGNKTQAAKLLGLKRTTLLEKNKKNTFLNLTEKNSP